MTTENTKSGAAEAAPLPPVTVARFDEAAKLIERLVAEKQSLFLEAVQSYREEHREATSRPLTAAESAQVAAAIAGSLDGVEADPVADAERIQSGTLRAYDDPSPQEFLLAAGVATAPAFLDAALRFLALLDMPADVFEAAREGGTLDDAIDERAEHWRGQELAVARARAGEAFRHYSAAAGAGDSPGEALRLLWTAVEQALGQTLATALRQTRPDSSLTGSLERTDGDDATASTESPTPKPSDT